MEADAQKSYFQFLLSNVPSNTESLTFVCNSSLNELRKSIIRGHRIITLYDYYLTSLYRDDKDINLTDHKAAYGIFNHKEANTFIGISQLSQNSSFLITYIHENLEWFAKAVLDSSKMSNFQHIISVSIPSLFGFFSSSEHLDYAHCFYKLIIDNTQNPELAVNIILPFIKSVATYRFLESAFTIFFDKFLLEEIPENEEELNLFCKKYSRFLLECLKNSVKLLPEQILQLFSSKFKEKWPQRYFTDLLLIKFIWPASIRWINASFAEKHKKCFNKVLSFAGEEKDLLREFYHALFYEKSRVNVPQLFQNFHLSSILFYICVNDVYLIVNMLNSRGYLSKINDIDISDFQNIDKNFKYVWFWCYIYPKSNDFNINDLSKEKLVFGNCEPFPINNPSFSRQFNAMISAKQDYSFLLEHSGNGEFYKYAYNECINRLKASANSFENLMELKLKQKSLVEWKKMIDSCELNLLTSSTSFINSHQNLIEKMSKETQIIYILKSINDNVIMKLDDEMINEFRMIKFFGNKWDKKFIGIQGNREISKLLCSLKNFGLPGKYQTIIKAMKKLEILLIAHKIDEVTVLNTIKSVPGSIILSSYVQIHVMVVRKTCFAKIWEHEDNKRWLKFESSILKCMCEDKKFLEEFLQIQNKISELYERKFKKSK